jgi:hypothetical protein
MYVESSRKPETNESSRKNETKVVKVVVSRLAESARVRFLSGSTIILEKVSLLSFMLSFICELKRFSHLGAGEGVGENTKKRSKIKQKTH